MQTKDGFLAVRIYPALKERLREQAKAERRTITSVIEEMLEDGLTRRSKQAPITPEPSYAQR